MSGGTVNAALRRLRYRKEQTTGHGFRHPASTMLNEMKRWSADAIEAQLLHQDPNTIRGIYNGAKYLDELKEMMQSWADHLDKLRKQKSSWGRLPLMVRVRRSLRTNRQPPDHALPTAVTGLARKNG